MTDEDQSPVSPLSEEESDRLRRARVAIDPPRALEERTVAALRTRGLIRPSRSRLFALALVAAAAVAIVAGVAWTMSRRPAAGPAMSIATGPRYMLLLYAGADPVGGTPDERRKEYAQWARDVAARGVAISGEELSDETRILGADAPAPAPPRGFFIVEAPDLAAAERLASSCPHLRHGGRIVIRRIAG